ncbi:MAG TPA: BON domain-containing protein [Pyrinomonadaceae bacterium]|nr:BON domain-containing protein [Pyrinomonadaceae bacterium]
MNRLRSFLFVFSAILGVFHAGGLAQSFAPASNVTDSSIEQKVGKKLRNLMRSNVFDHITFRVNDGIVTLGGKVATFGTKNEAAGRVKGVDGVVQVINNIEQLPPSGFDDRIRLQALRTFVDRGPAQYFSDRNPDVRIIVENGRMTLEGFVSSRSDRNTLNVLAHGINGVFQVTNNLIVGARAY